MTLTYTAPGFVFVDSQWGTATAGSVQNLVNQVIDKKYHKQVQKKLFLIKVQDGKFTLYAGGK